jgi:serine/threonine-protein kinase
VYAAGIVLWETLVCQRLFAGETEAEMLDKVLHGEVLPPSELNPDVPPELDRVVLKALERNPAFRYWTAREMAQELDECMRPASSMQVAEWMESTVGPTLAARSAMVASIESGAGAPVIPFPASSVTELRSSSVVSHTLPSKPPGGVPATRSRTRVALGVAILASLAAFVVAAVAFRVGASGVKTDMGPSAGTGATPTVLATAPQTRPEAPPEARPETRPEVVPTVAADAAALAAQPPPALPEREAPPPSRHDGKGRRPRGAPAGAAAGAQGTRENTGDINTLLDTH